MKSLGISIFHLFFINAFSFNDRGHSLSGGVELESKEIFWQVLVSEGINVAVTSSDELKHSHLGST